ncbi:hypothetical protein [Streptomyces cacaoi]|uniref:hypothetical protein n=1 Tax=Streptomyces cacaoi TaxID=1898 RepID=UPI0011F2EEC2|nr:hypothetical protein [Streptomyces cacaoi]
MTTGASADTEGRPCPGRGRPVPDKVPLAALAAAAEADDRATLPAAGPPGVRRDLYRIDAARDSEPHMPGVVGHVLLTSGRALVGLTSGPVELRSGTTWPTPGTSRTFGAPAPHARAVLVTEHS